MITRSLFASVVLLAASLNASAALWTNVDPQFTVSGYIDIGTAVPGLFQHQITAVSNTSYNGVQFAIPYAYEIDELPPNTTSATAYPYVDANKDWESGPKSLKIYNIQSQTGLVLMSDTDIPLNDNLTPPNVNSSILATDSVPLIPIGNVTANVPFVFNVYSQASDVDLHRLFTGFFVVPVPEPSTLTLFAVGAMGLFARRRRA